MNLTMGKSYDENACQKVNTCYDCICGVIIQISYLYNVQYLFKMITSSHRNKYQCVDLQ